MAKGIKDITAKEMKALSKEEMEILNKEYKALSVAECRTAMSTQKLNIMSRILHGGKYDSNGQMI